MRSSEAQVRPSMLAEVVVGKLERGGAGTPAEIARQLGREWTEERVRAALAELFSDGAVGHNPDVGFRWVA
jgi:hypothetical protein